MNNKKILIILLILPAVFVFRSFFANLPLTWGDAPYFHYEGLRELVSEPKLWVTRGTVFGGINQFLWFAPIMFIYGLLGSTFNLNNEILIRMLFYFPSLVLSLFTPWLFARFLKFGKKVAFFTSLVYVFNTYYLLVVDGGQVGVALAYGLFPLVLIPFISLVQKPGKKNFIKALIGGFVLSMIDPRFLVIVFIVSLFWVRRLKDILVLLMLLFCITILSSYWVIPLLNTGSSLINTPSELKLVSLLNTLLLYQPHWPGNIFGVVTSPPWYFAALPILIFLRAFSFKKKNIIFIAFLFLVFAFLAKGDAQPFGAYYSWVVANIPFGFSLRDATKFFAPLLLFAGILIGSTTQYFDKRYKYFSILIYIFILFLVSPAILGKLNFVLSGRNYKPDILKVNEQIKQDGDSFRTAWFPEIHPISYHTSQKQSFDAKYLSSYEPFRSMNVGDYDKFNFTHNGKFVDWFKLFGIRYLVLQPDPRVVHLNEEQQKNYDDLEQRIATVSGLLKKKITSQLSLYEVPDAQLKLRASDRLVAVIGSPESIPPNIPFVFFEDGKLDPLNLQGTASESAVLYFDNKDQIDLTMSFLQKYFTPAIVAQTSNWAKYNSSQNLKWRFEALIRGVDTKEFDYGQGVAFSEKQTERIIFDNAVGQNQEYIIAVRALGRDSADSLGITVGNIQKNITPKRDTFEWFIQDYTSSLKQTQLKIENKGGFWIVSNIAVIPKNDWLHAQKLADIYTRHFKTVTTGELATLISTNHWSDVDVKQPVVGPKWVLYPDSYYSVWSPLPAYSTLNLSYIGVRSDSKLELGFKGQKFVRLGIYISVVSILIMLIVYLIIKNDKNKIC